MHIDLAGKILGKKPLERPKRRGENNIKTDHYKLDAGECGLD